VLVPALVGVGLFAAYVVRARRVDSPVIDLRLLGRPAFAASVGVMAFVGVIMYSQLVSLPLFLHLVHGYVGIRQGLLTTALGLGLLVSMSWASRRADVTGPRSLAQAGAVVTAVGLALFALFGVHLPVPSLVVLFVSVGLGFGAMAAPTFGSVYRTVPEGFAAQATTTTFIAVQVSASLGLTVVGLVLSTGSSGSSGSGPGATSGTFGPLFAGLAVAALAGAVLGRLLPGPPDMVTAEGAAAIST
jgi:MFS family permease